jgi:hypothetical protein
MSPKIEPDEKMGGYVFDNRLGFLKKVHKFGGEKNISL